MNVSARSAVNEFSSDCSLVSDRDTAVRECPPLD